MTAKPRNRCSKAVRFAGLTIDRRLFRQQRRLMARLIDHSSRGQELRISIHDRLLLDGLLNLCNALADQFDR